MQVDPPRRRSQSSARARRVAPRRGAARRGIQTCRFQAPTLAPCWTWRWAWCRCCASSAAASSAAWLPRLPLRPRERARWAASAASAPLAARGRRGPRCSSRGLRRGGSCRSQRRAARGNGRTSSLEMRPWTRRRWRRSQRAVPPRMASRRSPPLRTSGRAHDARARRWAPPGASGAMATSQTASAASTSRPPRRCWRARAACARADASRSTWRWIYLTRRSSAVAGCSAER